ncbi:MAG TPA: alkaline phosphatase family protein [Solirubrobacteraceae bacterium]
MRLALLILCFLLALAAPVRADGLPPVRHAFVIVLENKDFEQSFGPESAAPYLARTLTREGQLLRQYYGTSHASLGNYITMISGQAPNPDTQGDCNTGFKDVFPGTPTPDGQALGAGCVYPADVQTIAGQLQAKGLAWKGYMEDMGTPCRHPAIGAVDDTQSARPDDQYATRHNPFVYFHSVIDDDAGCQAHVVDLAALAGDLQDAASTPALSFITPDLCSDGHDTGCADGRPGGLASVDAFLKEWVPRITGSPAFADGGLLFITWDEANIGSGRQSQACCDQPSGPNTPQPGIFGRGGGQTGSVAISPFVVPGSVNDTAYNHYALLRSLEDLFGLGHLGYAAQPGLKAFGSDVFGAQATVDLSQRPGSSALCELRPLRATGGRRLAPGSLVISLRVLRRRGRNPVLLVTTARRARVYVREGRRAARRLQARRCGALRVVLSRRHGRVAVAASVRQGTERRTVVF